MNKILNLKGSEVSLCWYITLKLTFVGNIWIQCQCCISEQEQMMAAESFNSHSPWPEEATLGCRKDLALNTHASCPEKSQCHKSAGNQRPPSLATGKPIPNAFTSFYAQFEKKQCGKTEDHPASRGLTTANRRNTLRRANLQKTAQPSRDCAHQPPDVLIDISLMTGILRELVLTHTPTQNT